MLLSVHRSCTAGYPNADFDLVDVGSGLVHAAERMVGYVWSACCWGGGSRSARNFTAADAAVLDFDETLTKQEALERLSGYELAMGPSKNDQKDKTTPSGTLKPARDRFRVLIPFKRTIYDRELYEYNMRVLIKKMNADPLPYDAGRVWQPSTCIEVVRSGSALDVLDDIPLEETQSFKQQRHKDFAESRSQGGCMPREVRGFLTGKIPSGTRNDMLFKAACYFFQTGMTVDAFRQMIYTKLPAMLDHDKLETTIKSAAKRTGAAYF